MLVQMCFKFLPSERTDARRQAGVFPQCWFVRVPDKYGGPHKPEAKASSLFVIVVVSQQRVDRLSTSFSDEQVDELMDMMGYCGRSWNSSICNVACCNIECERQLDIEGRKKERVRDA